MTYKRIKAFWIALLVLFILHSVVSLVSYRYFTIRLPVPNDYAPADITTPAQRAAGESVIQYRGTFTPMPVIYYICSGYTVFGVVLLFMFYRRPRGRHILDETHDA